MLRSSLFALVAPAMVSAMAFPWAGPEPTLVMPEGDNWSPVPTKAPELGLLELFKRAAGDNTCGYINGISTSSLTCNNNAYVCATNTYYGVHGCCDPNSLAQCSIPTTCIASTDLAASCTDAACSSNDYIAKCTDSDMPYCYQWRYVYSTRTVMTEFGCADSAFTISVQRTFDDVSTTDYYTSSDPVIPISTRVVTFTPSAGSTTPSSTVSQSGTASGTVASIATNSNISLPTTKKKSKTPIGAIVGGVVGGLIVIGAIIFGVIFALLRKKKQQKTAAAAAATAPHQGPAPGVAEFKPQQGGFPPQQGYQPPPQQGGYYQQDVKPGFNQQAHMGVPGQEVGGMSQPYSPPMSPAPQYSAPLNQGPPPGVAEAHGNSIQPALQPQQPHPQQHQVYEAP